jgi:hypothetical protein
MAGKKKLTKEEITEKLEPVGEAVNKTVQAVSEMTRETAKKAAPAVKAAADMAKPAVKAAADKARPAVKKAGNSLRATGKKAASALVPEVYVQWGERELLCADIVEQVKKEFRAAHKGAIHSCRIYVKPEDGMAYYVINDEEGKLAL